MTKKTQTLLSNSIVLVMALFTLLALLFTTLGVSMDITVPESYEDFYTISGFEALTFDDTFLVLLDKGGIEVLLGITSIIVLIASVGIIALAVFAFVKAFIGDDSFNKFFPMLIIASLAVTAVYAVISIISLIVVSSDVKSTEVYTAAFVPLIIEVVLAVLHKVVVSRPTKK